MLSHEERTTIRKVSLENKKTTEKKVPEVSGALSHIGGAVMTGADLASVKISDIGSMIAAPAEALLDKIGLGTPKEMKEMLEQHRINTVNNIKQRREKLDKYVEAKPIRGGLLKVGTGFIEQVSDPIQMGMNIATNGFILNAVQNATDYLYEQTAIEGRNVKDFGMGDAVNIGIGIGMAGIVEGMKVDTATKLYDDVDYTKKFKAPLDKIIESNKEDVGVVDRKAIGELYKRKDSGQTLSLPRGYHGGETLSKTIDEGVIPRIKKISQNVRKTKLGQEYNLKDFDKKDVSIRGNVSQAVKPIFTEVELGKKQALGEIADDLSGYIIKNRKYDGVTPIGNILSKVVKDIEPEEMIKIWQGKSLDPRYKELQKILHNYMNEFVSIKAEKDLMAKETGFYLNTLYNKQHFEVNIKQALDMFTEFGELDRELILGQLKNIGEKVFVNEEEATRLGLNAGYYSLEETPVLLKKLWYDIKATTKSVAKSEHKGTTGIDSKSIFDVALEWTNMSGKEKYVELLSKQDLTDAEKAFMKKFQDEMLEKFESIFKGFEQNKKQVIENITATIVNERSGYNKVMEKFEPFTTAYKVDGDTTAETKWLDFTMDHETGKQLQRQIDNMRTGLSAYGDVREKLWEDLTLGDKAIHNMKNFTGYKLLFGGRHIREAAPNVAIVNSGAYRLGFDKRYAYTKGIYEMGKVHFDLAKNVKTILDNDLSSIADPLERFETEMFIRRMIESSYKFDKKGFSSTLQTASKIAGSGQLVSDVHRTGMAVRFTSKAMFDEFLKLRLDTMAPEMRVSLATNGIYEAELETIQKQIQSFGDYDNFLKFVLNSNTEEGGKLKSVFEQFVDIAGREFEPYEKDITKMTADGFLSKFWLNSQMLFKRYSMGAFNRAWKNITTYYDSDDILRYRFLKNGKLDIGNVMSTVNWGKGFKHNSMNLMKMSAGLWLGTQATSYLHGTSFGTSADEMVEAKFEAMLDGDYLPIIADGFVDSLSDYVGYDVMFGGGSAFFGTLVTTYKALQRAKTSDLENWEKVLYGTMYVVSPQNISRGIDNIKFGKNISTKLNTWSEDAQFLWKNYYRQDALAEQEEGRFPIQKVFDFVDWDSFFDKNIDKAYEVTNLPEGTDEKVVKTYAAGIMGLTEESIRNEHINYAFAHDEIEEREEQLKIAGLDCETQIQRLDPEIRKLFHCVMAFKQIDDPRYIVMALEEMNSTKDKKKALRGFLEEDELPMFDNFADRIFGNNDKLIEIASREYSDDTEGYIEFLQALRNEM